MQTYKSEIRGKRGRGLFLVVDYKDREKVLKHFWHLSTTGYPRTNLYLGYSKEKKRGLNTGLYLHNLILGKHPTKDVDHINRDKLDNRRINLRFCTRGQNMANAGLSKHNSSGLKGVSWHKQSQKWTAVIMIKGKNKNLGLFVTKLEAYQAYKKKLKQKHKSFSNPNL